MAKRARRNSATGGATMNKRPKKQTQSKNPKASTTLDPKWDDMFVLYRAYFHERGKKPMPGETFIYRNRPLGKWVHEQLRKHRLGQLTMDQTNKLRSSGIKLPTIEPSPSPEIQVVAVTRPSPRRRPDPRQDWEDMFDALLEFQRRHGHLLVPEDQASYRDLTTWLGTQKDYYWNGEHGRKPSLPQHCYRRLRALGVDFGRGAGNPFYERPCRVDQPLVADRHNNRSSSYDSKEPEKAEAGHSTRTRLDMSVDWFAARRRKELKDQQPSKAAPKTSQAVQSLEEMDISEDEEEESDSTASLASENVHVVASTAANDSCCARQERRCAGDSSPAPREARQERATHSDGTASLVSDQSVDSRLDGSGSAKPDTQFVATSLPAVSASVQVTAAQSPSAASLVPENVVHSGMRPKRSNRWGARPGDGPRPAISEPHEKWAAQIESSASLATEDLVARAALDTMQDARVVGTSTSPVPVQPTILEPPAKVVAAPSIEIDVQTKAVNGNAAPSGPNQSLSNPTPLVSLNSTDPLFQELSDDQFALYENDYLSRLDENIRLAELSGEKHDESSTPNLEAGPESDGEPSPSPPAQRPKLPNVAVVDQWDASELNDAQQVEAGAKEQASAVDFAAESSQKVAFASSVQKRHYDPHAASNELVEDLSSPLKSEEASPKSSSKKAPKDTGMLKLIQSSTCTELIRALEDGAAADYTADKPIKQMLQCVKDCRSRTTTDTGTKDFERKAKVLKIYLNAQYAIGKCKALKNLRFLEIAVDRIENLACPKNSTGDQSNALLRVKPSLLVRTEDRSLPDLPLSPMDSTTIIFDSFNKLPVSYNKRKQDDRKLVLRLIKEVPSSSQGPELLGTAEVAVVPLHGRCSPNGEWLEIEVAVVPSEGSALEGGTVVKLRARRSSGTDESRRERSATLHRIKTTVDWIKRFNADLSVQESTIQRLSANIKVDHLSLLHAAVYLEDIVTVKKLMGAGADPRAKCGSIGSAAAIAMDMLEGCKEKEGSSRWLRLDEIVAAFRDEAVADVRDMAHKAATTYDDAPQNEDNSSVDSLKENPAGDKHAGSVDLGSEPGGAATSAQPVRPPQQESFPPFSSMTIPEKIHAAKQLPSQLNLSEDVLRLPHGACQVWCHFHRGWSNHPTEFCSRNPGRGMKTPPSQGEPWHKVDSWSGTELFWCPHHALWARHRVAACQMLRKPSNTD